MSFKKNMLSLSILGSLVGAPACTVCDYKDAITLYPQDVITDIRFPLNKGEASTGITLSYSMHLYSAESVVRYICCYP